MFDNIWNVTKKVYYMCAGYPKGTGKYYSIRIMTNHDSTRKSMRKLWQKVFKETDYCSDSCDSFDELLADGSLKLRSVEGVLAHTFKQKLSRNRNSGFYIDGLMEDVTEKVRDAELHQIRLTQARDEERSLRSEGSDPEAILLKKQEGDNIEHEMKICYMNRYLNIW